MEAVPGMRASCQDPAGPSAVRALGRLPQDVGTAATNCAPTYTAELAHSGPEPKMPPHGGDYLSAIGVGVRVGVGDLEVHVCVVGEWCRVPGFRHLGACF